MVRPALLVALLVLGPAGLIELDPSEGEAASDLAHYTSEETVRTAEVARLAYVEVLDVPWVRDGGTRKWDLATGPDLALAVRTADGYEYAESRGSAAPDVVQGDFPVSFRVTTGPGGGGLVDVGAPLVLYVSDHDRTGSDLMRVASRIVQNPAIAPALPGT